ncbi:MAG: hypothetical protein ACXWEY_16405 [Bacteroidia bacterium]
MKYAFYHLVFILLLFGMIRWVNSQAIIPGPDELKVFDVIHYTSIKDTGYSFDASRQSNVAFFPAFPYLWKFSGLNIYGISILNIVLFYISFIFLALRFGFSAREQLLLLSVPSMFFMYLPYSEALYFSISVLLLAGMQGRNHLITCTGFLFASVTRSAANVFLPAIILTEWIDNRFKQWKNVLLYSFFSLAGIAIVAYIQYVQTGYAFGFIQTQQYWEHHLQWPKLRFTSWGQYIYLDAAALLFGALCMYISVELILRFRKDFSDFKNNKALVFSVLCISGLTLLALIMKGGSFFSLNRYIFPGAFFCLAAVFLLRRAKININKLIYILIAVFLFLGLFHFFVHISVMLSYFLLSLYLCSYFLLNHHHPTVSKSIFWLLYICNCLIQVHLANTFLGNQWVG